MGRPRTFDEKRVIDDAMRVFWEQGYEATSIDALIDRTGLSRSSMYLAFGSKRGLFDSALERYLDLWIGSMLESLEVGRGGLDDVCAFFRGIEVALDAAADPELGCLMVNSIAELAWRDERMSEAGEGYRERLRKAFLRALRRAEHAGELSQDDCGSRARLLAALTLGAFLTQRGNPDLDDSRRLLGAIVDQVEAWRTG